MHVQASDQGRPGGLSGRHNLKTNKSFVTEEPVLFWNVGMIGLRVSDSSSLHLFLSVSVALSVFLTPTFPFPCFPLFRLWAGIRVSTDKYMFLCLFVCLIFE